MKFMVFFLFVLSLGTSAYGQHQLHMIEMSTTSTTLGALSFSDDGNSTDKDLYFGGNYAYKVSEKFQLGLQGSYARFESNGTTETYGAAVGAIYNFSDDPTNSFYTSLYGGLGWSRYSGFGNGSSEVLRGKVAFGKRFALSNINLPNVTYSPEISYTRSEFTESGYGSNTVSIRFLQFSVFF